MTLDLTKTKPKTAAQRKKDAVLGKKPKKKAEKNKTPLKQDILDMLGLPRGIGYSREELSDIVRGKKLPYTPGMSLLTRGVPAAVRRAGAFWKSGGEEDAFPEFVRDWPKDIEYAISNDEGQDHINELESVQGIRRQLMEKHGGDEEAAIEEFNRLYGFPPGVWEELNKAGTMTNRDLAKPQRELGEATWRRQSNVGDIGTLPGSRPYKGANIFLPGTEKTPAKTPVAPVAPTSLARPGVGGTPPVTAQSEPEPEPKPGFLAKLEKKLKGAGTLSKIERGEIAKQLNKVSRGQYVETSPGHGGMRIKHWQENPPLQMLEQQMRARDIGLGDASVEQSKLDLKGRDADLKKANWDMKKAKYALQMKKYEDENRVPHVVEAYNIVAGNHEGGYASADLFMQDLIEAYKQAGNTPDEPEFNWNIVNQVLGKWGYPPMPFLGSTSASAGQRAGPRRGAKDAAGTVQTAVEAAAQ